MDKFRIISGEELVSRGATKTDATLPDSGVKDVMPNGSWLEQKQIQAALDARKHVVEVERIQKCGTLSHAEWRDDLKLAEVTQQTGSYWQYVGHHIGKKLYLNPEEALFLLEMNSLLLKHDEVTVSLQKAYSLLLSCDITLTQYKVYASLSRLGYKVFRHNKNITKDKQLNKNTNEDSATVDIKNTQEINNCMEFRDGKDGDDRIAEVDKEKSEVDDLSEHRERIIESDVIELGESSKTNVSEIDSEHNTSVENSTENVSKEPSTTSVLNVDLMKGAAHACNNGKLPEVIQSSEVTETNVDSTCQAIKEAENTITIDDKHKVSTENEPQAIPEPCGTESDGKEPSTICGENMHVEEDTTSPEIPNRNEDDQNTSMEIDEKIHTDVVDESRVEKPSEAGQIDIKPIDDKIDHSYIKVKLHKLRNRQATSVRNVHNLFENIPDLYNKPTVTVNVPSEDYIPKNVFTNKLSYEINMANVKSKLVRPESVGTSYSSSDDVSNRNVRRIRSSSNETDNIPFYSYVRFPRHVQFRQYHNWRPYFNTHVNAYQYNNMYFQRPFMTNAFDHPRNQFVCRNVSPLYRPLPNPSRFNMNSDQIRSRLEHIRASHGDTIQQAHLESLKTLIMKLKRLIASGNTQIHNVQSFQRILNVYNKRYRTKLRLTDNYDLVDDDNIVEIIEIEDDCETLSKKPRLESKTDNYAFHFNKLKQLALKLKLLEEKSQAEAAHRRAFSSAIKVFNESYNADVYLSANHEVIDRRHISLDSSSDSDCVIDESPIVPVAKKLKNPFSIFRRLSEKDIGCNTADVEVVESVNNGESVRQIFDKNWLPDDEDFGKAEVPPKNLMNARVIDSYQHEFLFDFYFHRQRSRVLENWVDLKISFLQHLEEINAAFQSESAPMRNKDPNREISGLSPIIKPEDCSDMPTILNKLRIISTNKDIDRKTSLVIHFDVYNRDVQNYRKTNPPDPHFRVICAEESSNLPTLSDVMSLHSEYNDNIPTVFAVVGISISYLQINNCDIPIYVANNDPS